VRIEEIVGINFFGVLENLSLPPNGLSVKVSHEGWPPDSLGGCLLPYIQTDPNPGFSFYFNALINPLDDPVD